MSSQRGPAWLENYVSAEEKLKAFRAANPTARITAQIVEGREPLTFRAEIYLEGNDSTIPNAVGHASVDGGSGNRKQSPTEKTETAAISRALTVMGFAGGDEGEGEAQGQQRHSRAQAAPQTGTPPPELIDRNIRAAMEILGMEDSELNRLVAVQFGGGPAWEKRSGQIKGDVLAHLNGLVDKAAQEAR